MDTRLEQDEQHPKARRFPAMTEDERDAIYPMLAPAAVVAVGEEGDAFDAQILAGLVNV